MTAQHSTGWVVLDPYGPEYPKLGATVEKFRRGEGPLSQWNPSMRRAYGLAVEIAIRSLQRSELNRSTKAPSNRDNPIGEARRRWLRGKLLACPAAIRRARKPNEWRALYGQAMKEKTNGRANAGE